MRVSIAGRAGELAVDPRTRRDGFEERSVIWRVSAVHTVLHVHSTGLSATTAHGIRLAGGVARERHGRAGAQVGTAQNAKFFFAPMNAPLPS